MARTESTRTDRHAANPLGILPCHGTRLRTGVCLAAVVLAFSACGLAASGPGLGFKVGVQTLESPIDLDETTRTRFEFEVSSARFYEDHVDLAFTLGGSSLGSFTTEYADEIEGVFIEESYVDDLSIVDIRLAARLYPLGDASEIRPYVGAGLGYFWFLDQWDYEYAETFEDPLFPGDFLTFIEHDEGTDTAANGFFPFITAGVTIPLGDQGELIFDFQYDFEKKDAGYDFGGPIYMIGGRFRF